MGGGAMWSNGARVLGVAAPTTVAVTNAAAQYCSACTASSSPSSSAPLTSCSCQQPMVFSSNLVPVANEDHEPLLSSDDAAAASPCTERQLDHSSSLLLPRYSKVKKPLWWSGYCHGRWHPSEGVACSLAVAMGVAVAFFIYGVVTMQQQQDLEPKSDDGFGFSRPLEKLDKPLVILISSDGFRWGYNWKVATPHIDRLRFNGVEAEPGMISVFPTKTFPNHYSMATGLYPAYHGIISNSFRDPDPTSQGRFKIGNLDPKWWLGEPIWETVVNHGLQAATYFWPGSQVVKGNWTCDPKYCMDYDGSIPYEVRVDSVLKFVDMPPGDRPSLITLYFEAPDEPGHQTGPDDPKITEAVARVDNMIGRLLIGLDKQNVTNDVTMILVGDHGMVTVCENKVIYLDDLDKWIYIPDAWVDSYTPVLAIRPPPEVDAVNVFQKISQGLGSGKVPNAEFLQVYLKEQLPLRLHYSDSPRIQPIIGLVAEGYSVVPSRKSKVSCGGNHGYDNAFASMRTIFIGSGPQFPKGVRIPSFENIELYHLITSILGLTPAPNNGTNSFAESLLLPHH